MEAMDSTPDSYSGTRQEKKDWLHRLAQKVVNRCWLAAAPSADEVRSVEDAMKEPIDREEDEDGYPFCVCRQREQL